MGLRREGRIGMGVCVSPRGCALVRVIPRTGKEHHQLSGPSDSFEHEKFSIRLSCIPYNGWPRDEYVT